MKKLKADDYVKLIQKQKTAQDSTHYHFEQETERLSIFRFRVCLVILFFLNVIINVLDFVDRGGSSTLSTALLAAGLLILASFFGISVVPQFRQNSYFFTFFLAICVGAYSVLAQYINGPKPLETIAVYVIFYSMMGFLMPWGGKAIAGICFPLYLFYPMWYFLGRLEYDTGFFLKSNLFLLFIIVMAIIASSMNEAIRYQEYALKKKMEDEKMTLEDYQTRLQRAYERMENLAIMDPLTGTYSRTYLTQWLTKDIYSNLSTIKVFSFIMFDVDQFKIINDLAGHQNGDRVLKVATSIAKEELFPQAKIFRYGGDEFCIILPGVSLSQAIRTAERIRARVDKHQDLFVRLSNDQSIHVTLSMGVTAEYVTGSVDEEYLIRWVDAAMLESKRNGRNCIHVFDPNDRKIVSADKWIDSRQKKKAS